MKQFYTEFANVLLEDESDTFRKDLTSLVKRFHSMITVICDTLDTHKQFKQLWDKSKKLQDKTNSNDYVINMIGLELNTLAGNAKNYFDKLDSDSKDRLKGYGVTEDNLSNILSNVAKYS